MTRTVQCFRYEAFTASGRRRSGQIMAGSLGAARSRLLARGELPVQLAPTRQFSTERAMDLADVALGLRLLVDLLESGLPLDRALVAFRELTTEAWKDPIDQLRDAIREGSALAAGFAALRPSLPPEVVGIVYAGEHGGSLRDGLRRAADYVALRLSRRRALRAALAYPSVLVLVGGISVGILIGVIVPRFALILADLGESLPRGLATLIALGDVMRVSLPALIVAMVFGTPLLGAAYRHVRFRALTHRLLRRVPVVRSIRFASSDAVLLSTMAALLSSGVPLRRALYLASAAVTDLVVREKLRVADRAVHEGAPLSDAFAAAGVVSAVAVSVIRVGERTGQLAALCERAAKLRAEAADRTVQLLLRFLEPALILLFAFIVALVAATLLQALYAVRPA